MIKNLPYKILLVLLLSLAGRLVAWADEEHTWLSLDGVHFAPDSSFTVQDDKYGSSYWSKIQKNEKTLDVVTLQLNEDTTLFLSGDHKCSVDVEITWTMANGTQDSVAKTLTIYQDTARGKAYNFRSSYEFQGGYVVKTRILSVTYDGVITTSFPKVFMLRTDIYINRVYKFNCDSAISTMSPSYQSSSQTVEFGWTPMLGADEYDLEYTFYDSASAIVAKHNTCGSCTASDFGFLFNGNATRVTVQGCAYSISTVFNPGYILYRIRPIHYDTLGNRIEGMWSSQVSTSYSTFFTNYGYQWTGHMNAFNWQYTAAFAEEGKRKEVTSYFDGTLRNRQSVTLNNTQDKAIIGETMYDHQGRAALTTLPAPIDSGKIIFYNNFNLNSSGVEYSRHDFDTGTCGFIPPPMDSVNGSSVARGSSGYYSSSNPDTASNSFDRYLPDAQGYPFTQTEYTPDNTGRISRQSIAGKTHVLGSAHETQYIYSKPSQVELDRLFGSEVGDNSHYLENMVIDANGQISVSYVDANGKTIATALAGQVPSNLHALPSYHVDSTLTISLLQNGQVQLNSTYALATAYTGRYYFTYKLIPSDYTDVSCSSDVCTDPLYDITLKVSGNCSSDSSLIVRHDSNFTLTQPFDTLCHTTNVTDTFSLLLDAGNTYNISRQIIIDPTASAFYAAYYLRKNTCLKPYSTFLSSAIANINFNGCDMTCATCLATLGSDTAFLRKYITQLHNAGETTPTHQDTLTSDTLYAHCMAQCNQLCEPPNECTGLYDIMLGDVSLGGQYCLYTQLSNGTYQVTDPTSVLNSDYKSPMNPSYYVNAAGLRDSVVINGQKFLPQQLSQTQFIQNWKPSWASSLVSYHPEYCYYEYCQSDTASNRYDYYMDNTSTYASAWTQGFLNPLGDAGFSYNINWKDPYFTGSLGSTTASIMKHRMRCYATINGYTISIWAMAAIMENCSADTLQGLPVYNCFSTADTGNFGSGCTGVENMQYGIFRGLYTSLKQHIQDSLQNINVNACNPSLITCIGESGCDGGEYANKQPRVVSQTYASTLNYTPGSISQSSEQSFVASNIQSQCDTTCNSNAKSWLAQLSGCSLYGTITTAESDSLIAGFVAVCMAGCNQNHPLGSTTTAGGQPDSRGDISLEDVIHRVLGLSDTASLCNGLDINMPPPYYDSTGLTGPQLTYYKPTSCQCGNISSAYTIYSADSSGETKYKNFGDFLTKYYGDSITEANAWALKSLCSGSCFFASTPIQMPLWMSCCPSDLPTEPLTVSPPTWTQKATMLFYFYPLNNVSFSVGNNGYIGCGGEFTSTSSKNFARWRQKSNSWSSIATYTGGGSINDVGFSVNGKGYVGSGFNTSSLLPDSNFYSYDTTTNAWTKVAKLPDSARMGAFSFVLGDTAYVGCGADTAWTFDDLPYSHGKFYTHFWKYDPSTNTWTQRASFPGGGRTSMAAFSIGNYGYAGCGYGKTTNGNFANEHNDMWRFDPSINKWTQVATIPNADTGIIGSMAFSLYGEGYVCQGEYVPASYYSYYSYGWGSPSLYGIYLKTIWQYNPLANTWSRFKQITSIGYSEARIYGIAFATKNDGYFGLGVFGNYFTPDSVEGTYDYDLHQLSLDTTNTAFAYPQCCITCANLDTSMVHFAKFFPSIHDTNPNYQNLLTNYLNQQYGFDLSYNDYANFANECDSSSLNTVHLHDGTNLGITLCNKAANELPAPVDTNPCYTYLMLDANYNAQNAYQQYSDSVNSSFSANYNAQCMKIDDSFNMKMPFGEYHYTLYYYDQAENLVKTVPPDGVHPITSTALFKSIDSNRLYGNPHPTYPVDSMQTRYWYNTLNSPTQQVTPDGDTVRTWYDYLGRLALSQNAVQKPFLYSYTLYDAIGRVVEVGQVSTIPQAMPSCFHCVGCNLTYGMLPVLPDTFSMKEPELLNFISQGIKTQVTHTYYDTVTYPNIPLAQQNLRMRIADITYEDVNDNNIKTYDNALHFTYDIEGNVATIISDNPHESKVAQRYKRTDYYYDLQSGKVDELVYQHDSSDQFIQIYDYDADNRVIGVLTSHDSIYFENDATYEYYDHGPLAREVIGQRNVQGMDYAYTLNGWLKGINSSILNPSYDMGYDGNSHDANSLVARDALGLTLEYFTGDYRAIGSSKFEAYGLPDTSLYNGNIAGATYSIKPLTPKTIGYKYTYDQLNRLNDLVAFTAIDTVNDKWNSPSSILSFQERVTYDENGNIFKYVRHGNTIAGMPLAMDSMNYYYNKGTNQLNHVTDGVPAGNYSNDVDNETSSRNYEYNSIGQLAKDSAGGLDTILWTIYNKIKKIQKYDGDSLVFEYDGLGNRIEKRFYPHSGTADTTIYLRDAQGNILTTYDRHTDTVRLTEWDIYGNKRLGSVDTLLRVFPKVPSTNGGSIDSSTVAYLENQKQYELDNHLGNVMVIVSDKKIPIDTTATPNIANYYLPNIVSANALYAYGSEIPGMVYQLSKDSTYNYGYQGSMKDNQIYGTGNAYTTKNRELDDRIPRWWSVDPKLFPWQSPYISMNDNPILNNDIFGTSVTETDALKNDKTTSKALNAFAHTKVGYKFLSKYAHAGDVIAGIKFTKSGEYDKKGVNLVYDFNPKSTAGGAGTTFNEIKDKNGKAIGLNIYEKFNAGKGWETSSELLNKTIDMFHENFIHADLDTKDFLDNGKMDYSNMPNFAVQYASSDQYQHVAVRDGFLDYALNGNAYNPKSPYLFPNQALTGLEEAVQSLGLKNISSLQIQSYMWNFEGGLNFNLKGNYKGYVP